MRKVQVGIDLGTTNTLAYCRVKGKMKQVKFRGSSMLPSVMYVEKQEDGTIKEIVGNAAKMKGSNDPDNYIYSSKTYIGLTGKNKRTWICHGKEYNPTDVATKILEEVHKKVRELYNLEEDDVVQAVITTPAYFTSTQSDETKRAGERAGMEVLQIVTEPVAAALAAVENDVVTGKVFVVDLGGGTFDVSVLDIGEKYTTLEIGGERKLGGDDFDQILMDYFLEQIKDDLQINLSSLETSGLAYKDYYIMRSKIRNAAKEAKEELSVVEEYEIDIPDLFEYGNGQHYDFSISLSRQKFNDLCKPLFKKIMNVIDQVVERGEKKFNLTELQRIFLVGGSCYIPKIQEEVESYFGVPTNSELDRNTLVAMGAGKIADSWNVLTTEKDRENPFEDKLQDIISHDMGIEVQGDHGAREFSCILEAGTPYPCEVHKDDYRTSKDNQESVVIKVYEKTIKDASDFLERDEEAYDLYGSFELTGIKRAPAGAVTIEVTFDYDRSRTLHVTARDKEDGIEQTVELHKGELINEQSSGICATDLYVLIDVSASMRGPRIEAAQQACRNLVENTLDLSVHRMGIITIGDNEEVLCQLTQVKGELQLAIDRISVRGGTYIEKAIERAEVELKDSSNRKAILIITDGAPQSRPKTKEAAEKIKKEGVMIATIGVQEADMEFLSMLATDEKLCFKVDEIERLSGTFGQAVENLLSKK